MIHPLTLTGAPNFRDLGGYVGEAGRTLRHRRLFRSDHLGNLAAADLTRLASALGTPLRVLDLRGVAERESAVCGMPGATVHSLPIEPTIVQKLTGLLEAGQQLTSAQTVELMQDTYRNFVRGNTPRFASLFTHVLDDATNAPLVFHCTAGKDRTGFAAALLMLALGVSRADVMRDYLLTNTRFEHKAPTTLVAPEIAWVLHRVQEEFLSAAFEAVDEDYGGLEAYFFKGLGLSMPERKKLGELYLEPAGSPASRWPSPMFGPGSH